MKLKIHPLIVGLTFASTFVVLLCILFNPRWETNDDVAMSMVAHGYGLAAYGTPNLLFSNVLWGYLVRALPTVHGVLGYSLATLGTIALVGTAFVYFLYRLGASYLTSAFLIVLLLFRPVLFPQFTINAGLLACAAVLGLLVYARNQSSLCLAASCAFAFLSYLVRSWEFALVMGVALPCLPWALFQKERRVQLALTLTICAILAAWFFGNWSTSGPDWNYFWQLNAARAPFTDFDAKARLLAQPDIMARHNLSKNDVELLSGWFVIDRQIANPEQLQSILSELGPSGVSAQFESVRTAISSLAEPQLFPLLAVAIVLLTLKLRRRVILSWLLFLCGLVAMGLVGRPGLLRVYFPLLVLLILLPIALDSAASSLKRVVIVIVLAGASLISASTIIAEARISDRMLADVQASHYRTSDSIVVWGDSFPFEHAFPLLFTNPDLRGLRIYGLGVFTFAPFAVARAEEAEGRGLVTRLKSADGIMISARDGSLTLLGTYCAEHLRAEMATAIVFESKRWTVRNARCDIQTAVPSGGYR
ncbi:hypothetical protein [Bradyrhizobium icense]|uniref:Glycosyltransferase RgtA/B/C/D-like domain-containing protein n=1 Tax=Bradyrhizobium icense TaxID=1274631 RepID=A0A1B1UCS8_9BRAD|nr:hypothetical protein [Bradyrhizobium icense]ANW00567.1 hypothetical protein LMTR13_10725 [Bradyrhizobium icense]